MLINQNLSLAFYVCNFILLYRLLMDWRNTLRTHFWILLYVLSWRSRHISGSRPNSSRPTTGTTLRSLSNQKLIHKSSRSSWDESNVSEIDQLNSSAAKRIDVDEAQRKLSSNLETSQLTTTTASSSATSITMHPIDIVIPCVPPETPVVRWID